MIVGIFALNIRDGGGVTHLIELLLNFKKESDGFDKIILWSSEETLSKIESQKWLIKRPIKETNIGWLNKLIFQFTNVNKLALDESCDVLFFPGGVFNTKFRPVVSMHRNLLPFEIKELIRYGFSFETIKLIFLRFLQPRSMKKADGVIFLTRFAKKRVLDLIEGINGVIKIIPHGVDQKFFSKPKPQLDISKYSFENPYKIINLSLFQPYKHQWNLAEAVSRLRKKGLPIECHFAGGGHAKSINRLKKVIKREDKNKDFLFFHGSLPYDEIDSFYRSGDLLAYTSSVETFGQTLVEGMASGLPVACSKMSCMPEILGEAGVYFSPLDISEIEESLYLYIQNPTLREGNSKKSYEKAKEFSWEYCASDTFKLIKEVVLTSMEKENV